MRVTFFLSARTSRSGRAIPKASRKRRRNPFVGRSFENLRDQLPDAMITLKTWLIRQNCSSKDSSKKQADSGFSLTWASHQNNSVPSLKSFRRLQTFLVCHQRFTVKLFPCTVDEPSNCIKRNFWGFLAVYFTLIFFINMPKLGKMDIASVQAKKEEDQL